MRARILAGLVPVVRAVLAVGCGGTSGADEVAGGQSLTLVVRPRRARAFAE